jgi:hypothetical protein
MRMLWWICGNIRRDRVQKDDIHERLEVTPVEKKLMQHRLKWFGHIQWRSATAPIHNEVIRWTGNEKRNRWRSNLIWDESIKRNFKDWCINKELALETKEWNLVIHVSKTWSSIPFYCIFVKFFSCPFSFFDLAFYCIVSFFSFNFLSPFVFLLFYFFYQI